MRPRPAIFRRQSLPLERFLEPDSDLPPPLCDPLDPPDPPDPPGEFDDPELDDPELDDDPPDLAPLAESLAASDLLDEDESDFAGESFLAAASGLAAASVLVAVVSGVFLSSPLAADTTPASVFSPDLYDSDR